MKRASNAFMVFILAAILTAPVAMSGVPQLINYQGQLSDQLGAPLDTTVSITFAIYDDPEDGSALWVESHSDVVVSGGLFSVLLGSINPLSDVVVADTGRWLGIQIPPDAEIVPRTRLASAPFSLQALNAETARVGGGWTMDELGPDSAKFSSGWTGDESFRRPFIHPESEAAFITIGSVIDPGALGEAMLSVNSSSPDIDLLHLGDTTMTVSSEGMVTLVGDGLLIANPYLGNNLTWSDDITVQADDAVMGLYSSPTDDYGSCISLSEVNAIGSLEDKWAILRETSNAPLGSGSGLRFTYGTDLNQANNTTFMRITRSGNIGIGSTTPVSHRLYVESSEGGGHNASAVYVNNTNTDDGVGMMVENHSNRLTLLLSHRQEEDTAVIFRCDGYLGGDYRAVFRVKNTGLVICDELELRGGTDLAEPFEISSGEAVPKGAIVVIDKLNPGKLTLSDRPYDTRVAGVISGAGGIKPGVTLTQENIFDQGQKVAISGRVYCLADASFGAIEPGDLLTTSPTPGHAMKAGDRTRAYGAVIGKAMTGLEKGQGLVLVLVSLQ